MDEKDDIIEKQIADAMIDTTTISYVDSVSSHVDKLDKRANILEDRTRDLYLESESLKSAMATRQDLENQRKQLEDEFKGILTKATYIVFVLFFIAILFGYFF